MSLTRKLLLLMILLNLKTVLCCWSIAVMSMNSTHVLDLVVDLVGAHALIKLTMMSTDMFCTWFLLSCRC